MNTAKLYTGKTTLLNANFIKITVISTLLRICTQVQITSMPLYFLSVGGSNSIAGLSMTFYTIAALVLRPFIGVLLDTRGRKKLLLFGVVIYMLSTVMYGFITFIPFLIILRVIHGISFSASSTATSTMVTDVLPKNRLTQGIAYFGMFGTLAIAVAPSFSLYMINNSGYSTLFYVTSFIAALSLIISFSINYDESNFINRNLSNSSQVGPAHKIRNARGFLANLFDKKAIQPSIIMLFIAFTTSTVSVFLPTFAIANQIDNIGIFFTVQAFAVVVSRLVVGKISDKKGTSFIIISNLILLSISLIGIFLSQSLSWILIMAVLYGFSSGCLIPQLNSIAILRTTSVSRGKASATFYIAMVSVK